MPKESRLTTACKQLLKARGFRPWKNHGSAYSEPGLSDLMAIRNGRMWFIETKRAENKEREALQIRFLEQMKAHGAEVAEFCDSIDDLKKLLQRYT